MKKNVCIAAAFILAAALVGAQDADAIMRSTKNLVEYKTLSTRSRMVVTAKDGSTSELMIDQYSKDGPNGSRMMIVFQKPATVAGTRFLSMDNDRGGTDQWMYLPGLGKVRRLAASESGGSFMGTDFSYDDISASARAVEKDTHTLLREEDLNGHACYVIQSVPKDDDFQYAKTISWIDKKTNLSYKNEMYNKRGELEKVMETQSYKDIDGKMTAVQMKVSSVAAGTSTTIFLDIVKYDSPIPESVFTTRYLETGRVK